ncbi:OmpA family protein [Arenibacter latericius]|uniref:OmpA family protein n=1 Tax=Arenibacter latericius TaxID=86104 RepID=UPI00040349C3|nr:OmpA family protein [Arenibacter latericius]
MKTIKLGLRISIFLLIFSFGNSLCHAQILKRLGKRVERAAEEAVIRKSEQKVYRETGKVMDTILDGKKGNKKKNKENNSTQQKENEVNEPQNTSGKPTERNAFGVYSDFTFVPGNKLLFYDDFAADALGDFPALWETNGSGEVVNISNSDVKWLSLVRRSGYTPTMENTLPENYTIEFDLTNNGYGAGRPGSKIYFAFLTKKSYSMGSAGTIADLEILLSHNGFSVRKVENFGGDVEVKVGNRIDRVIKEYLNETVHVSIAVNKKRLRIWINEEKLVDSPNIIQADIGRYFLIQVMDVLPEEGHFVGVSNFKIAESTEDLRSLLLKDGKFSTTGIYFDTAKSTVKKESYGILLDIANLLRDDDSISLQIIGHTDNKGEVSYNQTLSENRAATVKQLLIQEFGIREDRLQSMGKGESEAVDDNSTEKGRANNRRVEFVKL